MKHLYRICGAIIVASWAATIVITCGGSCGQATRAGHAIIDCTRLDEKKIAALLGDFAPLVVGDAPDWGLVEADAVNAGREIGGCALAEFVQSYAAGHPPAASVLRDPASVSSARATLEDFRGRFAGGATFHTAAGDL